MKVNAIGHVWWRRGRGRHVVYGLALPDDNGEGSIRSCPIYIEVQRGGGWVAYPKGSVELRTSVRGTRGRDLIMRQALTRLAEVA